MQQMKQLFGIAMVVIYIGAGLFFLLGTEYLDMNANFRIGFGAIVLVYGMYRGYQIYLYATAAKEEEEKEE